MKIRRYRPLTPGNVLIYGGLTLAMLAAFVTTIVVGAPAPAILTATLMFAGCLYGVGRYLESRFTYAAKIAWYSAQGVAVLPGAARTWLEDRKDKLDLAIHTAVDWWAHALERRQVIEEDELEDFINGCQLEVVVQDKPLLLPRTRKEVRAFTDGKKTWIWYPSVGAEAAYLRNRPGHTVETLFFDLITHEGGHLCLNAGGIRPQDQEAYMSATGWVHA